MRKVSLIAAAVIVVIIIVWSALGTSSALVEEYEFPVSAEDIEKVLSENEMDLYIKDHNVVDDSRDIFTLTNDDKITFGIDSQVKDNHKILNMTMFLPDSLSAERVNSFYHYELSKYFEVAGIFYGNKRGIDKTLNELMDYYLSEENYGDSLYWNKRVGNDHVKVAIKPMLNERKNQIVTLLIMPNELYENYLKLLNDGWIETAKYQNIKIQNSTVTDLKKTAKTINDTDNPTEHFVVYGQLEDIKENKVVPEILNTIDSRFLIPNKDKYLNAKLVDNTGSIDVFLEMTSLNPDELNIKRNHNVTMFYHNNELVYVVSLSVLYTEEQRAQETAKDFIIDFYTVDTEEVDNYKSMLNINTSDAEVFAESLQINDEVLKSLMTSDAYDTLLKNRQNLMFAKTCFEGNNTMQVENLKLSENKIDIENDEAEYGFEVKLIFNSNDGTENKSTSKGLIELDKIDGNWKVTGYRMTE